MKLAFQVFALVMCFGLPKPSLTAASFPYFGTKCQHQTVTLGNLAQHPCTTLSALGQVTATIVGFDFDHALGSRRETGNGAPLILPAAVVTRQNDPQSSWNRSFRTEIRRFWPGSHNPVIVLEFSGVLLAVWPWGLIHMVAALDASGSEISPSARWPILFAQTSIDGSIEKFLNFLGKISLVIAVLMCIWAGFLLHDGKVREALYALAGAFVFAIAVPIAKYIFEQLR